MAKKIPLGGKHGKGKYAIVDDEDYERVSEYSWRVSFEGYIQRTQNGKYYNGKRKSKTISLHRTVMNFPKNKQVDHINHNKLDNRKHNLRICTNQQNMFNQKKHRDNKSGYRGVYWNKKMKKWRAYVGLDNKQIHLGYYSSKKIAALAYNKMAEKIYGDYSLLNKI